MASKFLSPEAQFHAGVNGRELDETARVLLQRQPAPEQPAVRRRSPPSRRCVDGVLDHSKSGRRAAVLDLRRDHDPQRRLLQVLELRQYERLCLIATTARLFTTRRAFGPAFFFGPFITC